MFGSLMPFSFGQQEAHTKHTVIGWSGSVQSGHLSKVFTISRINTNIYSLQTIYRSMILISSSTID